jgi:hypothetical protein
MTPTATSTVCIFVTVPTAISIVVAVVVAAVVVPTSMAHFGLVMKDVRCGERKQLG